MSDLKPRRGKGSGRPGAVKKGSGKAIDRPKKTSRVFYDSKGNRRHPTWAELTDEEKQERVDYQAWRAERIRATETKSKLPERYVALVTGELDIEELDDEEVFRGVLRNKNGDFRGGTPKMLPREFYLKLQREQQRRFQQMLTGQIPDAMKAIERILNKRHPQPGDGAVVQAAFKTMERFAGKVPDNVKMEHSGEISVAEQNMAEVVVEYLSEHEEEGTDEQE